jgi:hypothetical protein
MFKTIKIIKELSIVLLPLEQIKQIEIFTAGIMSEDEMMLSFYLGNITDLDNCHSLVFQRKDLDQILLALNDFFKNDVVVWNIQEELPFD